MMNSRVTRWSAVVTGFVLLSGSTPARAIVTSEPPELEGTIVFGRFGGESGTEGLFVANADGTNERPLVDHAAYVPFVSDDGSRAVVGVGGDMSTQTAEIVNLDGSGSIVLDPPGDIPAMGVGAFTPDGSQLAFVVDADPDPSWNGIYIGSSTDVSDAVQIMDWSDEVRYPEDVSPDGAELLLYVPAPGDDSFTHGSLEIASIDGTNVRPLTPDGMDVPCCGFWSRDGSQIVFAELDGRLLLINPDTTEMTEVLVPDDGLWARNPNWSPDGSQIMFTLDTNPDPNNPAPNAIYVVNIDGTGLTSVIDTPDHKAGLPGIWWVPTVVNASN